MTTPEPAKVEPTATLYRRDAFYEVTGHEHMNSDYGKPLRPRRVHIWQDTGEPITVLVRGPKRRADGTDSTSTAVATLGKFSRVTPEQGPAWLADLVRDFEAAAPIGYRWFADDGTAAGER